MIQRIQSLYLLLTIMMSLLFLNGEYLTFFDKSGSTIKLTLSEIVKTTDKNGTLVIEQTWPILTIALIIPLFSLFAIFLFRKRGLQLLFTSILMILILLFIVATIGYSYDIISKNDASLASWYKSAIPVLQLIFSLLAYKGIKKDDDLIKSYDRVR